MYKESLIDWFSHVFYRELLGRFNAHLHMPEAQLFFHTHTHIELRNLPRGIQARGDYTRASASCPEPCVSTATGSEQSYLFSISTNSMNFTT